MANIKIDARDHTAYDHDTGKVYVCAPNADGFVNLTEPTLVDTGEVVRREADGWIWTTNEGVRHVYRKLRAAVFAASRPVFRLA